MVEEQADSRLCGAEPVSVLIQPALRTPELEKTRFSIFLDPGVCFVNSDLFFLGLSLRYRRTFLALGFVL